LWRTYPSTKSNLPWKESTQKIVSQNKKLIVTFEQKIKDKIAEFWGEKSHVDQITAAHAPCPIG